MKVRVMMPAIAVCLALAPIHALAADYAIVERIKVPDGGFDYATFDPATQRVYMPRGAFTTVIDVRSNVATKLDNAASDHIALPIPGTSLLLLTRRQGTIRILDAAKDSIVADLPGEKNPNSATYDPVTKSVLVMNKGSGTATIVDPFGAKVLGAIAISKDTLEFPVADGAGHVFDNIETTGEIADLDVKARKVARTIKLAGCEEPSGLAYDHARKLLIAACGNGFAKVVDRVTGKEVASLPIGFGPDAVIYDPMRKMAFVPCGKDGVLTVISLSDRAKIAVAQTVRTQKGTRTGTIDPATGRLYLMGAQIDPAAAGRPRGSGSPYLPGTFEVLVVAPGGGA